MSTEPGDREGNAEIVPLRPDGAPGAFPALPEAAAAGGGAPPPPVIYADITRVPGKQAADHPAAAARPGEHPGHDHPGRWAAAVAPRPLSLGLRSPRVPVRRARVGNMACSGSYTRYSCTGGGCWESHGLRSQAATAGDSREWMRLHKEAREVRKVRGLVLAAELAAAPRRDGGLLAPWWTLPAVAAAAAVPMLARAGRRTGAGSSARPSCRRSTRSRPGQHHRGARLARDRRDQRRHQGRPRHRVRVAGDARRARLGRPARPPRGVTAGQ